MKNSRFEEQNRKIKCLVHVEIVMLVGKNWEIGEGIYKTNC